MKKIPALYQLVTGFLVFISAMLVVRFYITQSLQFSFLAWNIFLAYIPFSIAKYLSFRYLRVKKDYLFLLGTIIWLLFFPNALYIITDLVHLQIKSTVPKWFDVILLFSSALLGLLFAFVSLYMIEQLMKDIFMKFQLKIFIILILFIASFGVYLGRFLRWNSWDIINNPLKLLQDVASRVVLPHQHIRTWGVTIILSILFYLIYTAIKMLPKIVAENRSNHTVDI